MDKSKKIIVNYKELVIIDLNESDVNLIRSSQKILENSYSPYSGFKVGCSVLLSSGKVLCANNQENVAYPSGMCAERVALFYASSKYPNSKILKIAVSARSDVFKINDMISPCGSCRQVIAEYERKQGSDIEIILLVNDDKILVFEKASDLLPLVFDSPPLRMY